MKRALALAVLLVGLPIVAVVEVLGWLDDWAMDADWLLLSGETFDTAAARLHLTRASLIVHLNRHRRADLIPRRTT